MTEPPDGGKASDKDGDSKNPSRSRNFPLPVIALDSARPMESQPNWRQQGPPRWPFKAKLKFAAPPRKQKPAAVALAPTAQETSVAADLKALEQPIMPLMTSGNTLLPFSLDESDPLLQQAKADNSKTDDNKAPAVLSQTAGDTGVDFPTPMEVDDPTAEASSRGEANSRKESTEISKPVEGVHSTAQVVTQQRQNDSMQAPNDSATPMEVDQSTVQAPRQGEMASGAESTTSSSTDNSDAMEGEPESPSVSQTNCSSDAPNKQTSTVFTVTAPPGKLGIYLYSENDGSDTHVTRVAETSVMANKLKPNDRIIAVDGQDVTGLHCDQITKFFAIKLGQEKKLTVLRLGENQVPEPESRGEQVESPTADVNVSAPKQTGQDDQCGSQTQAPTADASTWDVPRESQTTEAAMNASNDAYQRESQAQNVTLGASTRGDNCENRATNGAAKVLDGIELDDQRESQRHTVTVDASIRDDQRESLTADGATNASNQQESQAKNGPIITSAGDFQLEKQATDGMVNASHDTERDDRRENQTQNVDVNVAAGGNQRESQTTKGAMDASNEAERDDQRNSQTKNVTVNASTCDYQRESQSTDGAMNVSNGTERDDQRKSQTKKATANASIRNDQRGSQTISGAMNASNGDVQRESKPRSAIVSAKKKPEHMDSLVFETETPDRSAAAFSGQESVAAPPVPGNETSETEGRERVTVKIAPGQIGITLAFSKSRKEAYVQGVSPDGPSAGKFLEGDAIVQIDGCDVRSKKLKAVTAILKARRELEKEITVLRTPEHHATASGGDSMSHSRPPFMTEELPQQSPPSAQDTIVAQPESDQQMADPSDRFEDAVEMRNGRNEPDDRNEQAAGEVEPSITRTHNLDRATEPTVIAGVDDAMETEMPTASSEGNSLFSSMEATVREQESAGAVDKAQNHSQPTLAGKETDPMSMVEEQGSRDSSECPSLQRGNDVEKRGTPTLLEPSQFHTDDPDLKELFQRVEKTIVEAEEKWLLDKIDRSIVAAEEKELLARTERYIIAAEQAPMPASIGSKVSCLSTPEEGDGDLSSTPDANMLAQWSELSGKRTESLPETTSAPGPGSCTSQLDDQNVAVVEVHKVLPKYVENSSHKMFSHDTVQTEIVDWISKQVWSSPRDPRLEIHLKNFRLDDHSVSLYIKGRADVVEKVKGRILKVVRAKTTRFNLKTLLSDKESVEIDLQWDCRAQPQILSVPVADENGHRRSEGLWLATKRPNNEDLSKIIGYRTLSRGAAIVRVNDVPCATMQEFNETVQKAKDRSESAVKLTICLSKHADMNEVDKSMVWPGTKFRRTSASSVSSSRKRKSPDTFSGDIAHAPAKRKSPPPSDSSSRVTHKDASGNREPDKSSAYLDFVKKFEEVKDIEFRNARIGGHFVNGRMWDRHKALGYGTSCSDDCACAVDLPRLTETVVPEYIAEQRKKDPNWESPFHLKNGESPEGFVNNFASKFIPKLEAEYPKDTPSQTLQRLVRMWPMHKGTRLFGLKCRKDCRCGEGWDLVFKKGEKAESGTGKKAEGRGIPRKGSAAPFLQRSRSLDTAAPRRTFSPQPTNTVGGASRRGSLDTAIPRNNSSPQPPYSAGAVQGKLSSDASSLRRTNLLKATSSAGSILSQAPHDSQVVGSQQKEYSVTFDARVPLGFYCITERKGSSDVCKITSVNPHLKSKDNRLHDGTIVRNAAIVEGSAADPVTINSSFDLERCYESAKKRPGAKLRLAFINSDVKASATAQAPNKDWKSSGAWQGKTKVVGWAGGASIAAIAEKGRNARKTATNLPGPARDKGTTRGDGSRPSSRGEREIAQDGSKSLDKTDFGQPRVSVFATGTGSESLKISPLSSQRKKPGPSLLRKPRKAASKDSTTRVEPGMSLRNLTGLGTLTKRKVNFAPSFEVKLYRKDSCSCDFSLYTQDSAMEAVSPSAHANATEHDRRLEETFNRPRPGELEHAIREEGCKEVIRLLYAGASSSERDAGKALIKKLQKAKLGRLNKTKELDLKLKAMKIFIQCAHAIDRAMSMKKAMRYELEIIRMDNLQLTQRGKLHGAAAMLSCQVSVDNGVNESVQKPLMPLIALSETADWSMIENRPKYCVSHNASLKESTKDGKEVIITLEKGDADSSGSARLGRFIIPVSRITEVVENGGHTIETNVIGSEYLSSGTVLVRVRRKQTDAKYLDQKKKEIAIDIAKAVDWMEQFNKETLVQAGSMSMSGNLVIAEKGNFSLLHAAVAVADFGLVKRLMELGADPTAKSEVGSAIFFASNLDDAKEYSGTLRNIISVLKGHSVKYGNELDADLHLGSEENDAGDMEWGSDGDSDQDGDSPHQLPATREESAKLLVSKEQEEAAVSSKPYPPTLPSERTQVPQHGRLGSSSNNDAAAVAAAMAAALCEDARDQTDSGFESKTISAPIAHAGGVLKVPSSSPPHNKEDDDLPILYNQDWMLGQKERRCRFFNKAVGCRFGKRCRYCHVRSPVGALLDDEEKFSNYKVKLDSHGVRKERAKVPFGKSWVTAAYQDPNDGTIYYAERGPNSRQSTQGIYWYPNDSDALYALERVVFAWQHGLNKQGLPNSRRMPEHSAADANAATGGEMRSSQEAWIDDMRLAKRERVQSTESQNPDELLQKRARLHPQDNSDVDLRGTAQHDVFQSLVKNPNYSSALCQITGTQLKRDCWDCWGKDGYITAQFTLRDGKMPGVYKATQNFGGHWMFGAWWHKDERTAKASAFLCFLETAAAEGFVTKDLCHTIMGKTLAFGDPKQKRSSKSGWNLQPQQSLL